MLQLRSPICLYGIEFKYLSTETASPLPLTMNQFLQLQFKYMVKTVKVVPVLN
jgi:hypothetical protein